ncbi:MAG TPA: methyltransferase domain-containing protein [Candidatus Sulfotelmatobacter sp.]|nr:methyltransferase domain-containing protein [Candidatus Sulfotelmatobacter sp.]
MLRTIKLRIHGLLWVLSNPNQLKHIIIRETRYRNRYHNKETWTAWQKFDTHDAAGQHSTMTAYVRPLNLERIRIFSEMINGIGKSLRVLDVGCGDGVISEPIAKLGNDVASVDLPTITMICHKRRVSMVSSGDAEHLAFADNSFDVVLASEVVEHLWNPEAFFMEAYRILKYNGWLIIETPEGRDSLRYDAHKNWFDENVVQNMVNKQFTIKKVRRLKPELGAPTSTIILLMHRNDGDI